MRQAFLLSLKWHFTWFFEAMGSIGREMAPLSLRRLVLLLILYPLYLAFQMLHWIGFLLDELLFRGYRKTRIKEPLIITGVPRSGTTFVHRTLARDHEAHTSMETWEAILAPSITEKKLVRGLSRLDRAVGAPLHRLLAAILRKSTGGFSHIHEVDLHEPEEDYLALLPAGACFILVLAFPASPSLWQLGRFHEMPDEQKDILLQFYKACLQKHLYTAKPGQRLVSKNAAFGSWIPDLRFLFPDARYIVCVRQPTEALSSQLSSLRPGLEFFGTMPAADTFSLQMQTAFAHVYRIILEEKESFLVDHLAIVDQTQLKADPQRHLTRVLKQLGIPISEHLKAALEEAGQQSREHVSRHQHAPLTSKAGPSEFGTLVSSIYEEILESPHISRDDTRH